jgi:hypothetical protein
MELMMPGETVLTGAPTKGVSDFQVMSTPAGFYIGTTIFEEDFSADVPYSRESHYMGDKQAAEGLLNSWNGVFEESKKFVNEGDDWDVWRYAYEQHTLVNAR